MHRRDNEANPRLLWTAEEGRRKDKGVKLSMSPDTQVKEQHVSVTSFFKMKWKKYWRFVNNSQYIFLSSLLIRERRMKKRGSRASAISLNSR